jgi:hypothetical protein
LRSSIRSSRVKANCLTGLPIDPGYSRRIIIATYLSDMTLAYAYRFQLCGSDVCWSTCGSSGLCKPTLIRTEVPCSEIIRPVHDVSRSLPVEHKDSQGSEARISMSDQLIGWPAATRRAMTANTSCSACEALALRASLDSSPLISSFSAAQALPEPSRLAASRYPPMVSKGR